MPQRDRPDHAAAQYSLESLEDTHQLAARILDALPERGSLLILTGPLGAGKTTFTQQLATLLGSKAQVSSPSYTLIHEYPTPEGELIHMDAYRLGGADALYEFGLEDYLTRARLVVIEWGEALLKDFPEAWQIIFTLEATGRIAKVIAPQSRKGI
jgi:tRNA threonylcarbamoyladenosine biosynthesis protein TsaE